MQGTRMSNEWYRNYAREYRKQPHVKAARALEGKRRRAKPKTTWDYLRMTARVAVRNAIEDGDLVQQPCEVCGLGDTAAHHDDYTRPTKVRWLCRIHHAAVSHNQMPHPDYECGHDGCSCHWYWHTKTTATIIKGGAAQCGIGQHPRCKWNGCKCDCHVAG